MSTFFVEGFERSKISVCWWKIIQKKLSTFFARLGKDVGITSKPGDEASNCKFSESWRVKVKHCAVSVILNLLEDSVP